MVKYPEYTNELQSLLEKDQATWRTLWQQNYKVQNEALFEANFEGVRQKQREHTVKMLEILDKIGEPSLSNIGPEAAQAISIVALHDSLRTLRQVLAAFMSCLERDSDDTYVQAIPSMTDRVLLLERKPQRFGTQWEVDPNPAIGRFLPTVEDFEQVNDRRKAFGIEPLRWPKSLAIPVSEQPWLRRSLSELVMREITDEEFERNYASYIN